MARDRKERNVWDRVYDPVMPGEARLPHRGQKLVTAATFVEA